MPTAAAWTPDGRLLVAEKAGVVKLAEPGQATAREILDLRSAVHSYWDRGLLGIAVDGQFAAHPYVYLLFTYELAPTSPDQYGPMVSQLRRYRLTAAGDLVEPQTILGGYTASTCPAPSNDVDCIPSEGDSHSIGTVRSASDGTLYVGSGDGASYSLVDPLALRTYDERSLAGKIARIDRTGRGLPGHAFCPQETDLAKVCTKLYAKGFRNPFRFELLPGDGGLAVGDVGWAEREEVDLVRSAGGNYGWPCYEGAGRTGGYSALDACGREYAKEGTALAARPPAWSYDRAGEEGAVIGGPQYTGTAYPDGYAGDLFVADYAQRWVKRLDLDASDRVTAVTPFATDWAGVQLLQTPAGELAYVSFGTGAPGTGSVQAISHGTGNRAPTAVAAAAPATGGAPLTVRFSASGSSDPDGDPLTYRWAFGDGSAATTQAGSEHVYEQPGTYTATLTVDDGRGQTATDTVRVVVGNDPPVPRITAPAAGATFRAGEVVDLAGEASDPETGALGAEALRWRVTLHHAGHTHPIVEVAGAAGARFRAVTDHDADSWYEIELTATDRLGVSAARTLELRPETVPLRVDSSPPGAPVTYAGRTRTAPHTAEAAVGFHTSVSAAPWFVRDGRRWEFEAWSDGGDRLHDVTIPGVPLTLTATYRDAGRATGALGATSTSTAFGEVAPGTTAERTVTLRNTGASPVTITGSDPPGGQFALAAPLEPGTVVPAGGEVSRTVRYTPRELGEAQARWRVTASDGSIVSADVKGAGVIPDVGADGWRRSGAARLADGGLELTPAIANRRGAAFWPAPVDARRLDVAFDALLTGGTGADGLALVLADPARGATPSSLGAAGAGLGFAGIPGWAAALVTWKNNGVAAPFAGISDGSAAGKPWLPRWVATTRDVPPLRTATPSRVRVRVDGGRLRLAVNGVERVSAPVTLPDRVLVGFSGATGGQTDRHVVANASIGGAPGPALPPPGETDPAEPPPEPPALRVTSTIVAPPGSAQEATAIRVSGRCPAAVGPLDLAPGTSAAPALAGAVEGASCALEQDAIAGDGWSTTVTVNDGAPQPVQPAGGVVRVPAFALRPGQNTVVLTNRYQPPPPRPSIPDPASGGWQFNGAASIASGATQLTPASPDARGSAFWPEPVRAEGLVVSFDATVEGGTGADGLALVLGDPSRGATASSLGGGGGSLGFGGIPGWGVALVSYPNGTQAAGNFVGLSDGALAGAWQTLNWVQASSLLTPLQNTTRRVRVAVAAGVVTVSLDGVVVISRAVALPERVLVGFSAGTGGLTNRHVVRDVAVAPA